MRRLISFRIIRFTDAIVKISIIAHIGKEHTIIKIQRERFLPMIAIHFIVGIACNEAIIEIDTLNQMLLVIDEIAYIQSMAPFCVPRIKLSKCAVIEIGCSSIDADTIIP